MDKIILLEKELESAEFASEDKGAREHVGLNQEYSRELTSCYTSLPPGCDCVCNQPCHGEGPCYSL